MAKKVYTSSEDLLEGLKQDVLYLLLTILAHREKQRLPNLGKMSREDLVLELALLESGTRDIIARLTALDDDGSGARSFPNALAAMNREGLAARKAEDLKAQVKAYRRRSTISRSTIATATSAMCRSSPKFSRAS